MTIRPYDALIIGGGIYGCAIALFLARHQWRVAVLEKDFSGRHASGVNSGGVRLLGRDIRELPLALEAQQMWRNIASLVGDDCGFRIIGNLRVAENDEGLRILQQRVEAILASGLDYREHLIDRKALREIVPAISPHCLGAISDRHGAYAEPYRASRAFHEAARGAGAQILEQTTVREADYSGDTWRLRASDGTAYSAPCVVNCAGAWGQRTARMLDDHIPLTPNGSMQIVTERLPPLMQPIIATTTRALSMKQFANGTIVIGGGQRAAVDLDTNHSALNIRGLAVAAKAAAEVIPALQKARVVRAWSGIEGFTADKLPVIGPGSKPGIFHVFGFSGHGFQLAPAVGKAVAEQLLTGHAPFALDAFSPTRFATPVTATTNH